MTAQDTEIRELDPDTVARIAAGEVVERPASVVKELVENSLDADASRIEIAVEHGGVDGVRVSDDGIGMSEADVRAAVREHTTSKLDDADELRAVETLGFRGEALHTIGAVSRVTITTRPRADGDDGGTTPADAATRLRYEGGDVEAVESAGRPPGTTVEVEDLFFNTPARRKYLGERATEFRHVSRVVGRYALANPGVAVALDHDGSEVFSTSGQGNRLGAIMAVYGREVAEAMVPVDVEPDTPAVERVHGYVSHPETTRASREYLGTYVNDRYVEPDAIRSAVVDAYGSQLAADRYPFAALFVEVPPDSVDVNVHPRKLAVRFDDEAAVEDAVREAVREALLEAGLIRSSAPRGRSAPDETDVRPLSDDETAASGPDGGKAAGASVGDEGSAASGPGVDATAERGSGTDDDDSAAAVADGADASRTGAGEAGAKSSGASESGPSESSAGDVDASEAGTAGSPTAPASSSERGGPAGSADASGTTRDTSDPPGETGTTTPGSDGVSAGAHGAAGAEEADRKFDASEQRTLDGDAVDREHEFETLPPLRILGQLRDSYLVAEGPEGLVVIDQHAADERVHYERLRAAVEDGGVQALAEPVTYALTPAEAETVDAYAAALARLGFHADRDGRQLEVRSVPAVLGETLDPDAVHDVLAALLEGGDDAGAATVEATVEELLGDLACAPAVTANTSLAAGSVTALLAALDDCENPYECPHGRPTIVRIGADELADRFERDYPGHGQRRRD